MIVIIMMTITSTLEFETSLGRLSAHCTQMKLQWTISEFSQSLFQRESKCEILGMIIRSNFSMNNIQLSPEGEVNSGGYIPRREASRYISMAPLRP